MTTDHEMRMEALRLFEENERLRSALEIISRYDSGFTSPTAADALADIARRALKECKS